MERDAFLARVRRRSSSLPAPSDSGAFTPKPLRGDLVARFCRELEAVDGVAHRTTDSDDALRVVLELMRGHERFMARGPLPVPNLAGRLIHDGYRIVNSDVPTDPELRKAHQLTYETLEVGITGAEAALAESGSIVVTSGRESPRMASLIPETHIVLMRTDQIYPSLRHFLAERPEVATQGSNMVVITGPSRTGDIEQTLTLGVHGPRHLHAVLVPVE